MKNITIVGGGSAGWLTALYIKQLFPKSTIKLIESSKIGILGAGEGSVPMLQGFLKSLKIDEDDFIKKTKATFKLGISFENWNGDGNRFFHPFSPSIEILNHNKISNFDNISIGLPNAINSYYILNSIANKRNMDDELFSCKAAYMNKSGFFQTKNSNKQVSVGYSYHFDASLTADYLKNIGIERGIIPIDGEVLNFNMNENGDISETLLDSGEKIECDFIFDCSGFARLIIGKKYRTEWISYDDHLTVNTAIPFFLPQSEDHIKPYTKAISMKNGWMWQIPLQHRWGCGYVFNDEYTTVEDAKKEIEEYLGHPIDSKKVFKFNAGRYKDQWVNNCISIGLSSGFTEPLEATSLMISMRSLSNLDKYSLIYRNSDVINEYNRTMGIYNDEVVSFLYYHYLNQRNDTDFWKDYRKNTKTPDVLKSLMNKWDKRIPSFHDQTNSSVFNLDSWIIVGYGNRNIKMDLYENNNRILELDAKLDLYRKNYKNNMGKIIEYSFDHLRYIKNISKS